MANAIAKITAYLSDQENQFAVFKSASLTADLETPNVEFVGAKTVKVPVISFANTTMGTYSRTDGYSVKDVTLTFEEHTLTQDKGDELKLDKMDLEESGMNVIAFVNRYTKNIVTPSVDTYRFSKLATDGTPVVTGALSKANIVEKLDEAFLSLREHEIPTENTILYLPYTAEALLKNASGLTKFISEGQWNGQMSSKVKMYDDAKVVFVPASRFPSGVTYILVNPDCQWSKVKYNAMEFYERVAGWRGPVVDYNMYHDTMVKDERKQGVLVGKVSE